MYYFGPQRHPVSWHFEMPPFSPTPAGMRCVRCGVSLHRTDVGFLIPYHGPASDDVDTKALGADEFVAYHRRCLAEIVVPPGEPPDPLSDDDIQAIVAALDERIRTLHTHAAAALAYGVGDRGRWQAIEAHRLTLIQERVTALRF